MVNEEILAGLKSAVERGESLNRAMLTFLNSGYKKEEVEEAASHISEFRPEAQFQPPIKTIANTSKIKQAPQVLTIPDQTQSQNLTEQKVSGYGEKPVAKKSFFSKLKIIPEKKITQETPKPSQTIQKVSDYGEKSPVEKPILNKPVTTAPKASDYLKRSFTENIIIGILIVLLVLLVGALIAIFLFQQQLIIYFSKLLA
jgi:hypothetical protein